MSCVTGDWINNPETQAVCNVLSKAGHNALFVGGCVRNALMGVSVNDIDIATDALPERVLHLFDSAGLRTIPTGINHGTVTVVSGGTPHEITTFRRDVETDGRRATVEHTDCVKDDARRRDFTMNALYAQPDGTVLDPLCGLPDLQARKLRFIEDPSARIEEDYLRILRFFRFHAWYGDPSAGLDQEGLAACALLSAGIETLSKERIGAEMLKLLAAADPAPSVAAMTAAGCLTRVLPGADATSLPVLIHLEAEAGVRPDPIRRLAILGGEDVKTRLRLSKMDEARRALIWSSASDMKNPAEHAYRHGADAALDIAIVHAAAFEIALPGELRASLALGSGAKFPIAAADISARFAGPALGEKLRMLESAWIESGFTATRDMLLKQ